ncbi:MAG: CocE/NonD family hydrolase [Candidatus Solibacter usitatus]|nr:CocE/NonD family hydrolase [Candidatus Solibacter usitatus]
MLVLRIIAAAAALALAAVPVWAVDPITTTVRMRMRDGVRLTASLFRPGGAGRFPAILVRTPYGRQTKLGGSFQVYVDHGYAVVVQDVRGRYDSDGVFDPLRQEMPDGEDTLEWIARQIWSNGNVGMTGGSYVGIVQWKAALTANAHLKSITPVVSGWDDYEDRFYSKGGAMKAGNRLLWLSGNLKAPGFTPPDFNLFVRHLPIRDADRAATGQSVPLFQNAVEHPAYDAYWRSLSTREHIAQIKAPVLSTGGWYDNFVQSDLEAFAALRRLKRRAHAVIGPWPHNMSIKFKDLDFGPESSAPVSKLQLEWHDRWVKGETNKGHFPPLRLFVMGINQWRDEHEWPLARAVPVSFYFASRKGANGLQGDGDLRRLPSRREHKDRYTYDPRNPVPTRGGATCCNPEVFAWGPMDQRPVENRGDVLVYTSPPLAKDMEVTGPVKVELFVSTSAPDTDFTAKLVDVFAFSWVTKRQIGLYRKTSLFGQWSN